MQKNLDLKKVLDRVGSLLAFALGITFMLYALGILPMSN